MRKLSFIILFLGASWLYAQPYTGGEGDGYDMHEINLGSVAATDPVRNQLHTWIVGANLHLQFPERGGVWEIRDLEGRKLAGGAVPATGKTRWDLSTWSQGVYVLRWKKEGRSLQKKIVY